MDQTMDHSCIAMSSGSTRENNAIEFYTKLLEQTYLYQNEGKLMIFWDFNSRCGERLDYIEGTDDISPREVLDSVHNSYGYLLI